MIPTTASNGSEASGKIWCLVIFISLLFGFLFTHVGVGTWDSTDQLDRGNYILFQFGLPMDGRKEFITPLLEWYGPFWQLCIGIIAYTIFPFLKDPTWVRHASTFALFPCSLFFIWLSIKKTGYQTSVAWIAVGMVLSYIRLGGHSLINISDAPMAISFFICSIASWIGLGKLFSFLQQKRLTSVIISTTTLTCLMSIPYLIRAPMLFPIGIFYGCIIYYALERALKKQFAFFDLIPIFLVPLTFFVFTFSFWPALWIHGFNGYIESFSIFKNFVAPIPVRVLGLFWQDSNVPFWYPLLWLPISITPVCFICIILGLFGYLKNWRNLFPFSFSIQKISFPLWLACWFIASLASVLIMHPQLYDEDRHIFFLFTPLLIFSALGWSYYHKKTQLIGIILLFSTAFISYGQWQQYSYVYKSPLIGSVGKDDFTRDYWGVCIPALMHDFPDLMPIGSTVMQITYPPILSLQNERLINGGFLTKRPEFGPYTFVTQHKNDIDVYILHHNRPGIPPVDYEIASGYARVLKTIDLPTGERACSLLKVNKK